MSGSNKTIQGMIDLKMAVIAYCHAVACGHRGKLDLINLRDKLGPDHGALSDDLMPRLVCSKCRGKKIGLIYGPGSYETAPGRAGGAAEQ